MNIAFQIGAAVLLIVIVITVVEERRIARRRRSFVYVSIAVPMGPYRQAASRDDEQQTPPHANASPEPISLSDLDPFRAMPPDSLVRELEDMASKMRAVGYEVSYDIDEAEAIDRRRLSMMNGHG